MINFVRGSGASWHAHKKTPDTDLLNGLSRRACHGPNEGHLAHTRTWYGPAMWFKACVQTSRVFRHICAMTRSDLLRVSKHTCTLSAWTC
eukprot:183619-Pelagomonas_calceolata.AAC.1